MAEFERLSRDDGSLFSSYAENILRNRFALSYCSGRNVIDAGCGTGYGSHFLAVNGAHAVRAFDVSPEAIAEAQRDYRHPKLVFEESDALSYDYTGAQTIVNFETLAHLQEPERFVERVRAALSYDGTLIVSTPNGETVRKHEDGRPTYQYQHHAFTAEDLRELLSKSFGVVQLYGQWLTHEGQLRRRRGRELHANLCALYYDPFARFGRGLKRVFGKAPAPPPEYFGEADSFAGDYEIAPIDAAAYPWAPTTLIAVCTGDPP